VGVVDNCNCFELFFAQLEEEGPKDWFLCLVPLEEAGRKEERF